uniref:Spaetzle domain-containing protein n=1 Tax=Heliothis virescens TaxID=7102 RepID=A0A2A4J431_HELVI
MAAMATVYLFLLGVLLTALKTVQCNSEEASPMDIMKHEMPESCQGQSYCFEKGDDYPDEQIEKLLIDMLESNEVDQYTPQAIGSRYGDTYDEPDCPVNSMEGPIYYITDTNGNVRVVVQSPKKFQQIYSTKWCANEGPIKRETAHFLTPTLRRFKMECVTTKMNFDFFVLNDDLTNLKMEIASVKDGIPVCCKCRYNKRN